MLEAECIAPEVVQEYLQGCGLAIRYTKTQNRSAVALLESARRKILCKRFSTKSRMALENRADSGLDPLITESHGGQNGMCAGTA